MTPKEYNAQLRKRNAKIRRERRANKARTLRHLKASKAATPTTSVCVWVMGN